MMKDKKLWLFAFVVYILTVGISYVLFTKTPLGGSLASPVAPPSVGTNGQLVFDESLPKTQACPMNGELYSKQQESWWQKHRPLGVMIENHEEARPQSGINEADVTYEAVAEGGITRTLNVFYCQAPAQVGPVRSARTYFLDWISEYGDRPLYAHVGGANTPGPADALGQIDDYGWDNYNNMDQFSIGFPTFWRDYNRLGHEAATEHTMYSTTDKLLAVAEKRGLSVKDKDGTPWNEGFAPYKFKDDAPSSARPASQVVHLEFWPGYKAYFVDWVYDPTTNLYMRKNGGAAHIDRNTKKQLSAKTIVVMSMSESHANDGYEDNAHLLYKNKGTGKAVVFMDGKKINATWSKDSRTDRTIIEDSSGTEIKFTRGKLWFEILPLDGNLTVK
jgi:hypothetical protein